MKRVIVGFNYKYLKRKIIYVNIAKI